MWSTAPSAWSSQLRPSSFRNIDSLAAHVAHEMTSAIDSLQITQPIWCSFQGVTCGSVSRNLSFASIISIDLTDRALTGTLPAIISNFGTITYFSLQGNKIFGKIPNTIGAWSLIQTIDFEDNSLSGTVPYTISMLTSLRQLYLNMNQLVGSIPNMIGGLTSLVELSLSSNHLTGTIPASIGLLRSLQMLHLQENSLTGPIPSSIGSLTSLRMLTAYSNALGGSIPSDLGELRSLVGLYLYSNSLTGTIPTTIMSLEKLKYVEFQYNLLVDTTPVTSTPETSSNLIEESDAIPAISVSVSPLAAVVTPPSCTHLSPDNISSQESIAHKIATSSAQLSMLSTRTSIEKAMLPFNSNGATLTSKSAQEQT